MSYFRSQKVRKPGPRSITRLPNSTQKMSQEGGRVTLQSVPIWRVSIQGFIPTRLESGKFRVCERVRAAESAGIW